MNGTKDSGSRDNGENIISSLDKLTSGMITVFEKSKQLAKDLEDINSRLDKLEKELSNQRFSLKNDLQ